MKKIVVLIMAVVAVFVTSCQKDDTGVVRQSGEVDVAIKASLPHSIETYAAVNSSSDKGGIGNVNPANYDLRYIMEVWTKDGKAKCVYRDTTSVADFTSSSDVTFNARLLAKEYDFIFWADFVNAGGTTDLHYKTGNANLCNVGFNGDYAINEDHRDAYYGKQTIDLTNQSATIGGIRLQRPFGKIRFIATDNPQNAETNTPSDVTLDYGGNEFFTAFDVLNAKACETKKHGALKCQAVQESDGGYLLACDYILADPSLTVLSGVSIEIKVGNETFTKQLPEIPVAANKLTTVMGNFYTNEATLTVEVEDAFTDDEIINLPNEVNVTSIDEVNGAITDAATSNEGGALKVVVIEEVTDNDAIVVIPSASVNAEQIPEITLDLSSGIESNCKVTIGGGIGHGGLATETEYAGTINIIVPTESMGNLEIKAPNAHVTINGVYQNVTASTSASTLVIGKETIVEKLEILSGNVKVYGKVGIISRGHANSDAVTYVYKYDGATITTPGSDEKIVYIDDGKIQNITTGVSYATIQEAIDAAAENQTIELAEGDYPLEAAGSADSQKPVLGIPKKGLTLRGNGNVVIYGAGSTPCSGYFEQQSMIYITGENVTLEGLTIMPLTHTTTMIDGQGNVGFAYKGIEVDAPGFTMRNCTLTPNTKTNESMADDGGGLFFDVKTAGTVTITGNTFTKAVIYAWSSPQGLTYDISKNTFTGQRENGWFSKYSIVDTNNGGANPAGAVMNVTGNAFTDMTAVETDQYARIRANVGTINLQSNTFPDTSKTYWTAIGGGKVVVNGQTVYGSSIIAELIAAASANDVITLPSGNYNITETITIDKSLTIKGSNPIIAVSDNAGFDVQANLTLNDITINSLSSAGKAPITLTKPGVEFKADQLTLNVNGKGSGNGNPVSMHALGIYVKGTSMMTDVKVTLTNSAINLNQTAMQMGVVLGELASNGGYASNLELVMENSTIISQTANSNSNASRSFGVHIGDVKGGKVTLKNCRLENMHYPVRGRDAVTESTLDILVDNSLLTGYCAIATRGAANITVQNGSVLTGRNFYSGVSNDFATIVFQEDSSGSQLVVDNSTITNFMLGDAPQYLVSVEGDIELHLRNHAKLIDTSKSLEGLVHVRSGSDPTNTENQDSTVELVGRDGVSLILLY